MRRYLSWIEGLTTNQYVGGSNPSRRTTCASSPHSGLFLSRLMLGSSGFANFFGYELERASMSVKMPPFPSCLKSHPFLTRCFASFQCTCHTGGFIAEKNFPFFSPCLLPQGKELVRCCWVDVRGGDASGGSGRRFKTASMTEGLR